MATRSPSASAEFLNDQLYVYGDARERAFADNVALSVQIKRRSAYGYGFRTIVQTRYAQGEALDVLRDLIRNGLNDLVICQQFIRTHTSDAFLGQFGTQSSVALKDVLGLLALTVCLCPDREPLEQLKQLVVDVPQDPIWRMFCLAFVPESSPPDSISLTTPYPWAVALAKVLAAPEEAKPAEATHYLARWESLMRPLGLDPADKSRFADFAFELALAVCVDDVDDIVFRDHPYYPRDLVDHYRRHLRHTRDAWRSLGVGAGVPINLRATVCERSDLTCSKLKGAARWIELAVGGDKHVQADLIERFGNPRKIQDIGALAALLTDAHYAVHADIKDDVTVEQQLHHLFAAWDSPAPASPTQPTSGPARCTALLRAARDAAVTNGLVLAEVDGGDDAWHAVLLPVARADEFAALSKSLGVQTRLGAQAFAS